MGRFIKGSLLALALSLLAGCPSASTLGSARTLDMGRWEGGVTVGLGLQRQNNAYFDAPDLLAVTPTFPVGASVRYGLIDWVEVRGGLDTYGLELGAKLALFRSSGLPGRVDISVAPGVTQSYFGAIFMLQRSQGTEPVLAGSTLLQLPLLVGVNLGGGSQLVLAPRAQAWLMPFSDRPGYSKFYLFTWGASAGLYLRLSDGLRLAPEVGVFPGPGVQWVQASVGLLVGN